MFQILTAIKRERPPLAVTQHALERYMQRSGATRVVKSLNKIERLASRAVRIGKTRFYADGWILKVVRGEIVTMFKPKYASDLRQIYKAVNHKTQ